VDFRIDRDLQVPLRTQIRGMIEYGIACGELQVGQLLPSVRELAESFSVAPMTVSLVYRELKNDGLIETRPGAGTFVADSSHARMAAEPAVVSLHRLIDDLIDRGMELGMRPSDFTALVNARLNHRMNLGNRVSIVMIGLFDEATASYAKSVAAQVGGGVSVEPMIIADIKADEAIRHRAASADLALTFANAHREVSELLPSTTVMSIRFIPSETTRLSLASFDPLDRVLVVSRFPDFLAILKSGVQRFAAHVQNIGTANLDDPSLAEAIKTADVVVYSTGAERVRDVVPVTARALEYRHAPDPGDIERLVVPFVHQTVAALSRRTKPGDVDSKKEEL
jgi:DNA-binding transcriptional regulator YhcF (GntR family)